MDFRSRLREAIEFSGLLDKEVAERAGITKRAIDSYVGSRSCMPSADVAVRLANVLGVTVEFLVTGETASKNNSQDSQPQIETLIKYFYSLSHEEQQAFMILLKKCSTCNAVH